MTLKESTDAQLSRGDPAPGFTLTGADGGTHALADYTDYDAVLIIFTCNHCPYAKAKMPALNGIAADYDRVAVIGINANDAEEYPDDSFERMQALVEEKAIRYDAYLHDADQDVAKAYGAVCTPDPFLFVNEDLTFTLFYHGRLDDAMNPDDEPSNGPGATMRAAIDAALSGDEPPEEQPSAGCSIKWKPGNEPGWW